jgi:hypothetical protein
MSTAGHSTRMPAEIGRALVAVKAALDHAQRSGSDSDDDRQFSYATADDIFAAVQKKLAEQGLLLEMLDEGFDFIELAGEDGTTRPAIHMRFLPVWNWFGRPDAAEMPEPVVYENARNVQHMVGPYEGMKTCAGLRTTAEKTYLRTLLKLPTSGGERPGDAPEGETEYTAHHVAAGGGGTKASVTPKPVAKSPFAFDKQASAEKREEIVAAMKEAADTTGDHSAKVAAVNSVFRKQQTTWAKLAKPDQAVVKQTMTTIIRELAEAAGQAA